MSVDILYRVQVRPEAEVSSNYKTFTMETRHTKSLVGEESKEVPKEGFLNLVVVQENLLVPGVTTFFSVKGDPYAEERVGQMLWNPEEVPVFSALSFNVPEVVKVKRLLTSTKNDTLTITVDKTKKTVASFLVCKVYTNKRGRIFLKTSS